MLIPVVHDSTSCSLIYTHKIKQYFKVLCVCMSKQREKQHNHRAKPRDCLDTKLSKINLKINYD